MPRKHPTLDPGTSLDRFKLERLIGTGAFGQVWTAIDEGEHGFRKRVALKILAESTNQKRIEALMHEARICGALNHPNIIDVYGVMRDGNHTFIIMEYVEGETLSAQWKDLDFLGVRFPRSITLDIAVAVCEALYHAWDATDAEGRPLRIVHRDLKPANVIISDRGIVKVGDFGIAKASAVDPSTTRAGKLKGTPSYLAPEVWQGKRDFRPSLDLWSLGVILWEMAVGKRFFGRASMAEIFDLVLSRSPEDEARQAAKHFPELEPILIRLLQRDQKDRYDHPLKVAEKLRRIRQQIGSHGDLLQFSRLVRAGRLEPEERQGSLIALPALPLDAEDWVPLISVAAGDGGPVGAPWDTEPVGIPVKLGPSTGEEKKPDPGGATRSSTHALPDLDPGAPDQLPPKDDADAVATVREELPQVSTKEPAKIDLPPQPKPPTPAPPRPRTPETEPIHVPDVSEPRRGPPWGALVIIGLALVAAAILIIKTVGS